MPTPAFVLDGQPRFYDFLDLGATASSSLVKSSGGFFHALTITAGTVGTVTLYDNTEDSGTVIAAFDAGGFGFSGNEGTIKAETYIFDVAFQTGLVVGTTGPNTPRVTISYR